MKHLGLSLLLVGFLLSVISFAGNERSYLTSALKAHHWLQSNSIETATGKTWPADPKKPALVSTDLYHGTAGVILFYLELFGVTKERSYLEEAMGGADYLQAALPYALQSQEQAGLYTGVAGVGYVLEETFRASGELKYHEGALKCVELLHKFSKHVGGGAQLGKVTDIIEGSAGTGLFLLYAAKKMKHNNSKDLAIQIGRRLLELGIPEHGGLKWAMDPSYPYLMPNFSHGTAGIAYFLATLYSVTQEKAFLEGALGGGRYLLKVTNKEGLIFHHEPGGNNLFYLGWCHGPPGSARLYYRLWKETKDDRWLRAIEAAAEGLMKSGIPEKGAPGFWNNVGQCCGSAGVAELFLVLYRITGQRSYLDFSIRLTADLLARATQVKDGLKWIHAEHRVKPNLLIAQTGYMQGAGGIGLWLLHLEAFLQGKSPSLVLPDSPY